jgi:hypothetical protein
LGLLHHLVRCASGERMDPEAGIDIESMRAGIELVRWFGAEDRRIYAMLNEDRAQTERRELVELIRRRGGTITARDRPKPRKPRKNHGTALVRTVPQQSAQLGPPGPGPRICRESITIYKKTLCGRRR